MADLKRNIPVATEILKKIIYSGKLADSVLQDSSPDLRAVVYSSLRFFPRLQVICEYLLDKPIKSDAQKTMQLLLCSALNQLLADKKQHAVVNIAVNSAKKMRLGWAAGLINRSLREWLRRSHTIDKELENNPVYKFNHPKWWLNKIIEDWPQRAEDIFKANDARAPMVLRINRLKTTADAYLALLNSKAIAAQTIAELPYAVQLKEPCAVTSLPEWDSGFVSLQDLSGQFLEQLLDLKPGDKVLDACAAPGSKTCAILEAFPNIKLTACDVSAQRLEMLTENLTRLGLSATVVEADVGADNINLDQDYDVIILDAPCTGSGVVRRHPDIKLLRCPDDIKRMAARQKQLICALFARLRQGGIMIYSTCSIFKAENDAVVSHLLHNKAAQLLKCDLPWGVATECGIQFITGAHNNDGFYFAKIAKQ